MMGKGTGTMSHLNSMFTGWGKFYTITRNKVSIGGSRQKTIHYFLNNRTLCGFVPYDKDFYYIHAYTYAGKKCKMCQNQLDKYGELNLILGKVPNWS